MTTAAIIERFRVEYQVYHGLSRERVNAQLKLLRKLGTQVEPRTLAEIDGPDLQNLLSAELERGLHVNTVRKQANMIRPFVTWAWEQDILTSGQYRRLRAVRDPRGATANSTPRPYKRAELRALRALIVAKYPLIEGKRWERKLEKWIQGRSSYPRIRRQAIRLQLEAIIALALDGGLRRAEIFQLEVDDLHPDNAYLVVTGKGGKVREVPFTKHMRASVANWLNMRYILGPNHNQTWLSLHQSGSYNHPMMYRRFQTLLSAEFGEGWQLHRLRHTAATEWLRAGVRLETVSRLLGHASLQQTLAYAEIVKSDIAREMGNAEEQFRRNVDDEEDEAA